MVRRLLSTGVGRVPASDLMLAMALATFGVADVLLGPDWRGPATVNVVAAAALGIAVAWRRVEPVVTVTVVMGILALLAIGYGSSQTWTSVFVVVVAVYSVAAYAARPWPGFGIVALGILVRDLNDPLIDSLGSALWSSTVVVLVIFAGLAGRHLRRREDVVEQRETALELAEQELAAAAAAEERGRIARELHDIVSHSLGVLVLQAGAAEAVLERDPGRARETLQSIRATGQEALAEMGTLLGLVQGGPASSREPQPTLDDLPRLVQRTRDAGVEVTLDVEGRRRRLPAALELSAYRAVQEGVTNALKHAQPAAVTIRLHYGETELLVEVLDDGGAGAPGEGGRRGLAGLRERVGIFGGQLRAGPALDGGWALQARFPVTR